MQRFWVWLLTIACLALPARGAEPESTYDLLVKGGRVIDAKNAIDGTRDVAIWGGRIAAVEVDISEARARKVVDASGLIVVPGLVDIHAHVYVGTGERNIAGDLSVTPDAHAFRAGVTTLADAGTSGWRTFPDFHDKVILRSQTRVLAWLNIVGRGMGGRPYEQLADDMDPAATATLARQFPETIIGIKTAHYDGPEWIAVEQAIAAAESARLPVMVDFGTFRPERPYQELVLEKLRPGDVSTHMYVGLDSAFVPLLDENGKLQPYLGEARRRGVKFDVGHGFESFPWAQVVPAVQQGWLPDSISTDLYARSLNAALQDMPTLMSKFLSLGVPLPEVIRMSTWEPAQLIGRNDLGHLDIGAEADLAVLKLHAGEFGLLDVRNITRPARERLECELTLRAGRVVWDRNGRAGEAFPAELDE